MSNGSVENHIDVGQRLRTERKNQKLSLQALADKANLSVSLLSKIETGKTNPSFRSLSSIANALSLPIQDFFSSTEDKVEAASISPQTPDVNLETMTASKLWNVQRGSRNGQPHFPFDQDEANAGPIIRATKRPKVTLQGGVSLERLTPQPGEKAEFLFINYEVGARSGDKMSHHAGRKFIVILEGELFLELGFESCVMSVGDSITFEANTPHRLSNAGQTKMRAILVVFS